MMHNKQFSLGPGDSCVVDYCIAKFINGRNIDRFDVKLVIHQIFPFQYLLAP